MKRGLPGAVRSAVLVVTRMLQPSSERELPTAIVLKDLSNRHYTDRTKAT